MTKNILAQAQIFLEKSLEKLPRHKKWIVGGLSAIVIGGVIAATVVTVKPVETAILFSQLEISDAARITEYLKANKIDYQSIDNSSTIIVPKNRVDEIRIAVATQDLIQDSYIVYELFDKTNLGMEFVQQLNFRRALESELQRTIKAMQEIKDVKVHLIIPQKPLFKQDEIPPSAAVKLRFKSGQNLNKMSIENIQNLVASSVAGLNPDKVFVFVMDNSDRMLSHLQ